MRRKIGFNTMKWNETQLILFIIRFYFFILFLVLYVCCVISSTDDCVHRTQPSFLEAANVVRIPNTTKIYISFVEFYRDRQLLYILHTNSFFAFSLSFHEIHSPYSIVLFVYLSSLYVLIASQITLLELFVHVFHSHTQL